MSNIFMPHDMGPAAKFTLVARNISAADTCRLYLEKRPVDGNIGHGKFPNLGFSHTHFHCRSYCLSHDIPVGLWRMAYGLWLIAYGSEVPTICHKLSAICEYMP